MASRVLLVLIVLLAAAAAHTDEAVPLFENDAVVDIELSGPLTTLIDSGSTESELPFTLRAEGVEHQIQVRLRGKSRLRVCSFPPLRLNFVASAVEGTLFEDQDKLKLVTHCRGNERSEQDMLLEYAAYRVLNIISDVSYRVRQVRITYIDTDAESVATGPKYGFLLESQDSLGDRIGIEPVELAGVSRGALDAMQASLVFIFHYLIGNTDWSLVAADGDEHCCHNGHLFSGDSGTYLVPYDFDLSGIVNAPYAEPDPSLGIRGVTRRLYRGYCVSPEQLAAALDRIAGLQEQILAVPASVAGLSDRRSARAQDYLQEFFDTAENRERLLSRFENRCL
ncbi:MAG: hypothetical protein QNI99_08055 [Woeseiaceae bacterium]|nr:hypothetical protein [Woeseiaceae bacterium]